VDDEKEILNCCPKKAGEIIIHTKNEQKYIITRNKVFENPTKAMLMILSYADGKTTLREIIDNVKEKHKDYSQGWCIIKFAIS